MNERILELAKRSGLIQYETDGKIREVEDFAKLLVNECASIAFEVLMEKAGRSYLVHKLIKVEFGA